MMLRNRSPCTISTDCLVVLIVLSVIATSSISQCQTLSSDEVEAINKGLEGFSSLAETLKEGKFSKALTNIGSKLAPFLGVLGPVIGVALSFLQTESAELQYMKYMMEQIDNRFDQMGFQFQDTNRLIEWSTVKDHFGRIERKILALADNFKQLYTLDQNAVQNETSLFIRNFGTNYDNSGTILFQAFIRNPLQDPSRIPTHLRGSPNTVNSIIQQTFGMVFGSGTGTFQEDLGTSIMRYTKNDRRKTQRILLGCMKLLLQAIKLEVAYRHIQRHDSGAQAVKERWLFRVPQLTLRFTMIDVIVKSKYHNQSISDILEHAAQYARLSNRDFSSILYTFLSTKYYWRDWLVIIYDDVLGSHEHHMRYSYTRTCDVIMKFRQNGRNIVVASKESTTPVGNIARAKQRAIHADRFERFPVRTHAQRFYNAIDHTGENLCFYGVFRTAVYVQSKENRYERVNARESKVVIWD